MSPGFPFTRLAPLHKLLMQVRMLSVASLVLANLAATPVTYTRFRKTRNEGSPLKKGLCLLRKSAHGYCLMETAMLRSGIAGKEDRHLWTRGCYRKDKPVIEAGLRAHMFSLFVNLPSAWSFWFHSCDFLTKHWQTGHSHNVIVWGPEKLCRSH